MEDTATHIYALALAISTFGKRVLEIGGGMYSTSIIHAMAGEKAMTIENNPEWIKNITPLIIGELKISTDIVEDAFVQSLKQWDVVFIDCYHAEDRISCADFFLDKTCIVAHDTERDYWKELIGKAKYKRHFDFIMPRTSWLSNAVKM